jgi:hypothetical protein
MEPLKGELVGLRSDPVAAYPIKNKEPSVKDFVICGDGSVPSSSASSHTPIRPFH